MKRKPLLAGICIFLLGAIPLSGLGYQLYKHTEKLNDTGDQAQEQADQMITDISGQTGILPSPAIEILSEEAVETEAMTQPQTDTENTGIETEKSTEASSDPVETSGSDLSDIEIPADHRVIFVGDSRTVGMGRAEKQRNDNCIYIGESGEGYSWFLDYGMDQLKDAIKDNPSLPVVYNLGVNDCDAIASYIEVYKVIESEYPDTEFWYMSVNPVTEESVHVPNSDVLAFNEQLCAAFPDQYIDTCSWMMKEGFEDVDGVHYSEDQYCKIHDFAVRALIKSGVLR